MHPSPRRPPGQARDWSLAAMYTEKPRASPRSRRLRSAMEPTTVSSEEPLYTLPNVPASIACPSLLRLVTAANICVSASTSDRVLPDSYGDHTLTDPVPPSTVPPET